MDHFLFRIFWGIYKSFDTYKVKQLTLSVENFKHIFRNKKHLNFLQSFKIKKNNTVLFFTGNISQVIQVPTQNIKKHVQKVSLPYIRSSFSAFTVLKDGASVETSQPYVPSVLRSVLYRKTCVAFDIESWRIIKCINW